MNSKKWTVFVVFILIVVMIATACGSAPTPIVTEPANSPAPSVSTPLKISFASASDTIELFRQFADGMEADAKILGIELKRYDNNLDAMTAINNARLMVEDKPDIIIDWNASEGVGNAIGEIIADANIPCIAVNQPIPGCHWFNLSNKQLGIAGGEAIAKVAISKGWTADNTLVLIGQASAAGWEVNDSPRYFYVTVADLMNLDKVDPSEITTATTDIGKTGLQYDCKNTLEDSYAAVKNLLPSIPTDKYILTWAPNEDCTFGAYRAIDEAGRADHVLTGGPIGLGVGLTQMRTNPQWVVQMSVFIDQWSKYVLPMAIALRMGLDLPNLTVSPQASFDINTVSKYYDANNKTIGLPPLVPGNDYLLKTGVMQKFPMIPIP
jgi:ribose transport system substrate-binding protein